MADFLDRETIRQLRERAREFGGTLGDVAGGVAENVGALGTSMASAPFVGAYGLGRLGAEFAYGTPKETAFKEAARATTGAQEKLSYQPQTDLGQRGAANIAMPFEYAKEKLVDPIGERVPWLGAGILAAAEVVGPKGKPRAKLPRVDPGTGGQMVLPGFEPLTKQQALEQALQARELATERMSFDDPNRGMSYTVETNPTEAPLTQRRQWPLLTTDEAGPGTLPTRGDRPISTPGELPGMRIPTPDEPLHQHRGFRQYLGDETTQRVLEKHERLRGAQERVSEQVAPAAREEVGATTSRIQALREEAAREVDPERRVQLEREIYFALRGKPIVGESEAWRAAGPEKHGGVREVRHPTHWDYNPLSGPASDVATPSALTGQRLEALQAQQRSMVEALRTNRQFQEVFGEQRAPTPDWVAQLELEHPGRERGGLQPDEQIRRQRELEEALGAGPSQMNREAVNAFLKEARTNPHLFEYGLLPERVAPGIEGMAEAFGRQAGEDIRIKGETSQRSRDYDDEPYIKQEKTHGRGEVMRDVHGDPIIERFEAGEKLKKEGTGEFKMQEKEVELHGPPEQSSVLRGLWGTKEVPKRARGSEWRIDESGEVVYEKSRGGEPVRDKRGRIKTEKVENPDYNPPGDEDEVYKLYVPGKGEIEVTPGDTTSVYAMKGGDVGALLYQTLLAEHARTGAPISGGGLTPANSLRMLSNVLANIGRTGKNPRDVRGVSAGKLPEAPRGMAEGPEVWRALTESTRERVRRGAPEDLPPGAKGGDPERVQFDPEKGFTLDNKPIEGNVEEFLYPQMAELSPGLLKPKEEKPHSTGVGAKMLMKKAVFDWLRRAGPEQAAKVAREWKKYGPLFGVAGISLAELQGIKEQEGTD